MSNQEPQLNSPDRSKDTQGNDFPGYPHQPAGEDITNRGNSTEQVRLNNMENSAEQRGPLPGAPRTSADAGDEDAAADVTPDDVEMLSAAEQNRDMDDPDLEGAKLDETDDDGDPLNEPQAAYGATGSDLDVPGSEDDDANESIGEEDEENNYYSLGGDNHENLEEDNTSV